MGAIGTLPAEAVFPFLGKLLGVEVADAIRDFWCGATLRIGLEQGTGLESPFAGVNLANVDDLARARRRAD